jgi:hypothetical protein
MGKIITMLFLSIAPLSAAIFHPIDTTVPISCPFSLRQHNRILIENSRIKKVIFPEDKLYVRMEETSGQVFIQPKNILQEKIVISIISQTGIVQDIEIEFKDQPSQVVILQETLIDQTIPMDYPIQEVCCTPYPPTNELSTIVETILQGQIPPCFSSLPITNSCTTIRSGITAKLVGRLQGCFEDLYIYQIHNTRIWKKRLQERDLACGTTTWVYLQKNCLQPKETVLAIMAVPR